LTSIAVFIQKAEERVTRNKHYYTDLQT